MYIHIHHFHSKGAIADRAALEQFQQQWATYQKLVDSDALAHQEVGAILHRALAAIAKPFAFLDIACGDAGQMRKALAGTKVRHYHGIDLSEPALELAAKNLAGVPFEVELDHRDFVAALTKRPEKADAAWCGLSIHHLAREGKHDLFKAIHGSTSSFLMIYEPSLAEGETREAYLELGARRGSRGQRNSSAIRRASIASTATKLKSRPTRRLAARPRSPRVASRRGTRPRCTPHDGGRCRSSLRAR